MNKGFLILSLVCFIISCRDGKHPKIEYNLQQGHLFPKKMIIEVEKQFNNPSTNIDSINDILRTSNSNFKKKLNRQLKDHPFNQIEFSTSKHVKKEYSWKIYEIESLDTLIYFDLIITFGKIINRKEEETWIITELEYDFKYPKKTNLEAAIYPYLEYHFDKVKSEPLDRVLSRLNFYLSIENVYQRLIGNNLSFYSSDKMIHCHPFGKDTDFFQEPEFLNNLPLYLKSGKVEIQRSGDLYLDQFLIQPE